MKVKGTSIKSTRDFVKAKFPNRYGEWIKALPPESQKLYTNNVNVSEWFDLKIAYTDPLDKIVKIFYNNDAHLGGIEMGMYSAEVGLKGIYKVFLLVATPQYLMKRATRTMQTFYQPSEIEVTEQEKNTTIVNIKEFEELTLALEYRFVGWIKKALELCRCRNINYNFISQKSSGNPTTSIKFKWEM